MSRLRNPRLQRPVRARLGDEDLHGHRRSRPRAGHAHDRSSTTRRELEFWKYTVRNADHGSKGDLKVKDVIALSRNVATAKIATKLAPNEHPEGRPSSLRPVGEGGHDRPDRRRHRQRGHGHLVRPRRAPCGRRSTLPTAPSGRASSVTLPQLARGVSTLVNGGYLVQPHLVADGEAARGREAARAQGEGRPPGHRTSSRT